MDCAAVIDILRVNATSRSGRDVKEAQAHAGCSGVGGLRARKPGEPKPRGTTPNAALGSHPLVSRKWARALREGTERPVG